ncbi:MAG: calcium-binding protein, partial [Negativicutes bacterium]
MAQITTIDVVWSMYGSYNDGMKRIMDTAIEKGIIEDSLAVKGCKVKFGVAGFIGDGISISVALYEGDSDAFGRAVSRAIGGYIGSYILGGWLAAQGAKVNPWLGVVGGALGVGAGSLVGATSGEMAWDMLTDEQKDKLLAVVNLQVHCNKSGDPIPNPHESPGYDDNYKNYFNCKQLAKEYSNTGYIRPSHDPIALDLDGDGVEFVKSGAYFDYDGNKFAERATWLGKDDGWLTRDVNGDGAINDGTELFGDSMKKKDGTLAKNGFDALAEFDDNKDGVIDDKDAVYSQLRVWQDANGNGISDAGELKTLAEVGIKQLNLNKTDVTGAEQANGESVRQQGSFVWNSGVIGQMNGYVVNRNVVNSKELEILPVPDDIKTLPDVRGWGNVHSLQQAIVRDASGELKKLVTAFINTTGKTEREDFANQIILKWCGVENIDPKTRGPEMDARKLAALEKLFAEGFWSKVSGHGANPHAEQVAELNKIYDSLIDNLYCELLVKSTALQFIIQPTVDASGKTTGYNLDYAKQMLDGIIAIDQNAGLELLGNYCRVVKTYGYMDNTYADHQKYLDFYNNYSAKGGDYEEALVKFSKDAITGGIGADNLTGTSGNDKIFGLAGDDAIDGGLGNDTIYGGEGNDWIVSGSGDDYAEGGAGNDVIYGGAGNDALKGGDGGDWIEAGIGSDYIEGGA